MTSPPEIRYRENVTEKIDPVYIIDLKKHQNIEGWHFRIPGKRP